MESHLLSPILFLSLDGIRDATASPALADLDFSRMFHRLIVGPSPYPWPMFEAFREALTQAGVVDAQARMWTSGIPIRTP